MKTKILLLTILIYISPFSFSQIIHVPEDQSTIQAGINVATNGDTVLGAQGTLFENINFNGKAITVASHFLMDGDTNHINNTIIDGSQPVNPDFGSAVTFITGEDTTSIICGFTITGGTGMYLATDDVRQGGGIVCFYATARIDHNKIINNVVTNSYQAGGGGIACVYDTDETWIIIENNTITGNSCNATDNLAVGGGIYATCNVWIRNNSIKHNESNCELGDAKGGGVFIINGFGSPDTVYIINNTISYNSITAGNIGAGGGLWIYQTSFLELIDNQISYNTINLNTNNNWYGPGCFCSEPTGKTTIRNNEFSNNSGSPEGWGRGAGLYVRNALENEVTIDANLFLYNSCFRGGGMYERNSYNMLLTNNIFSHNSGTSGGEGRGGGLVMYHPQSMQNPYSTALNEYQPLIINNTFCSNTADYQGGSIHYNGGLRPPVIFNNIFWGNVAPTGKDINNVTDETVVVAFSDIDTQAINGPWTGEGNIYADPGIIDDSCHLDWSSLCVNAGIESLEVNGIWYSSPPTDIDGEDRPFDGTLPDIGADEAQWYYVSADESVSTNHHLINVFPNPFYTLTTIVMNIGKPGMVSLKVYDLMGQEVATLLAKKLLSGEHRVEWNAESMVPGVYYLRIECGHYSETIKLLHTH